MRGRRNLDLAALLQLLVTWNQVTDQFADQLEQRKPFVQRELIALLHQPLHQLVLAAHAFAGPRQVIPDQQIGLVLRREIIERLGALRLQCLVDIEQPLIMRERRHHFLVMALEAAADNQLTAVPGKIVQIAVGQRSEQGVADFAARELLGIVFELIKQHRHKIESHPGCRVAFKMPGHVRVILDCVQIAPGQDIFAGDGVAIIRLMHVPVKIDV